jgi:hypothetical protein
MKKYLAVLLTAGMCATSMAATPKTNSHDGSWWRQKSSLFKEAYIDGYSDGDKHDQQRQFVLDHIDQVVDGLNAFYRYASNRHIRVEDAMDYVYNQLQGASQDALATQLQQLRTTAAGSKAA